MSFVLMLFAAASTHQAKAADRPSCDLPVCSKHRIAMDSDGSGGHFCLQCMSDAINEMEDDIEFQQTYRYATETVSMEAEQSSCYNVRDHSYSLADMMESSRLLLDQGQVSGGYVASSAMVGTRSGLSLPATARYSFDGSAVHKPGFPAHDDSHGNLAVESIATISETPSTKEGHNPPSQEGNIPRLYDALLALHGTLVEVEAEIVTEAEALPTPVQVTEAFSIAHSLIELLEQEGYKISGTEARVLRRGEVMMLLREEAELSALVSLLTDFNIEFASHSLSDLKSLLLSGKSIIVRIIQKNGMITLIHIHPAENDQARIITEVGMQSMPINIDNMITLLNGFLASEGLTDLAMFTHEGVVDTLPDDPAYTSQGAMLTNSLTVAITEYIQELAFSSPETPPIEHTGAIQELSKTHDQAKLALSMTNFGFEPGPTEGSALQNVEALTGAQTPFMAQLIAPDQQVTVINFQPEASGDVILSLSGQHFVIDRREIGALFDWIINQFKPVIHIFILTPLFF
ncbi:hypothetical protein [Endozoicomonas sp. 8E]|uniref:hypothetical protein n=1 Tax=Endozoicomonas sp. 8E TaxID=3035692 RepID=UPI002939458C|nr:hypothetical protein [Endozoicomonas sp. 8E]WOG28807.1 hypothetical protein P6910_03875 [Endozoicomonas sp. 8E]